MADVLGWRLFWLCAVCCALCASLGCESLQRKLTRKPKHPKEAPSPIIHFQDYSRTMTPLDRYRKHYLMFDYWNAELMEGLRANPLNLKRVKRASSESLAELKTLRELLMNEFAAPLEELVEGRAKIDQRLQEATFSQAQAGVVLHLVEFQTRRIHRELSWRDVEDRLKTVAVEGQEKEGVPY